MTPALMFDLETADNTSTSAIASIGAVLFDARSDWIGDTFHIHVSLENCQRHGLTIGASTFLWWLVQSDEARMTLSHGQLDPAPLVTALESFSAFGKPVFENRAGQVWCNGASFDIPILANAYRAIGFEPPWRFYAECDLRTLKSLNKFLRIERTGTHHNALDDAINQARLVQHILQSNPDMDA